jgi:5'(3')-deoxyribonucleotidase
VVVNFIEVWLEAYNEAWQDSLTPEDITDYAVEKFVRKECGNDIYELLGEPDFFLKPNPFFDGLAVVKEFVKMGHDVWFATKCPYFPEAFSDKAEWIDRWFPEIGKEKIVYTYHKGVLDGDMLIDDYWENLRGFNGTCYLIDRPYNREVTEDPENGLVFQRVTSWFELHEAVKNIDNGPYMGPFARALMPGGKGFGK